MICEPYEYLQDDIQVVGDCSNIVDGAMTTCVHTSILASLLVLDSAAVRDPSCSKYHAKDINSNLMSASYYGNSTDVNRVYVTSDCL